MGEELESEVGEGEVVLAEDQLRAGWRLPFPWVMRKVLHQLNLAPTQLMLSRVHGALRSGCDVAEAFQGRGVSTTDYR